MLTVRVLPSAWRASASSVTKATQFGRVVAHVLRPSSKANDS